MVSETPEADLPVDVFCLDQLFDGRLCEEEALEESDSLCSKEVNFFRALDAFGNDEYTHHGGGSNESGDDGLPCGVFFDAADETAINLDAVGLKVGEESQSGEARTEVVEGGHEVVFSVGLDDDLEMIAIDDLFVFGEFEGDEICREVIFFGGGESQFEACLRMVDRIGQKVDVESFLESESSRGGDGLDAAGLIKGIAIFFCDASQHMGGTLSVWPANQGLIGIDGASFDVDDGLKGHDDRELTGVCAGS